MDNFGVIEVASTKTKNAPGWAYVPDVGPSPSAAALQPTNRKRAARNQAVLSASDLSARQEAKIRKDLEALDRDIHKDAVIAIPLKGGASRTQKHTPNVRKILQSQKTFANHLDDYQALLALAETNPAAAAALMNAGAPPKPTAAGATASNSARNSNSPAPTSSSGGDGGGKGDGGTPAPTSKRSAAMAKRAALATANEKKEKEAAAKKAAAAAKAKAKANADAEAAEAEAAAKKNVDEDVEMADAPEAQEGGGGTGADGESQREGVPETQPQSQVQPTPPAPPPPPQPPQIYPPDGTILPPYKRPPPPKHEGDNDPLLVSYVPRFPTDDELRALLTAPPLNYLEARAVWGEEETRYPQRSFCDVCGYWGRVRCMKCGARACALDCLNAHKEECVTRYGL